MKQIHIVTDSTCDIPPDLAQKWQVKIVPCYINFGKKSYLDKVELSREEFYQRLRTDPVHPTTAAPPPGLFAEVYRQLLDDAIGIVSIHPPDKLSALRQSALNGWDLVSANLPFIALDGGQLSIGLGWTAIQAAQAAANGASMDQIKLLVADLRQRVHLFAALSTIEYLYKSGRVGWAKEAIGRLLRIRPMLHLYQGEIHSIGFTRTQGKANDRLRSELDKLGALEKLTLLHTAAPELAIQFRQYLTPIPTTESVDTINATPVLGTHVGPGGVGFVAIQRKQV